MNAPSTKASRPLRSFQADLHVHTALSPCASEEMTPPAIVAAAVKAGLDIIAVSDHNAAGNVAAVQEAAKGAGDDLAVFAGMEVTSSEEAHVLAVFPDPGVAADAAARLRGMLPHADADYYERFGDQPLLDAGGRTVGAETAALAAASTLDLTSAVEFIHELGGLAIAAHVDRKVFSVYSQLGLFPRGAGFDAIEVSRHVATTDSRLDEYTALGLPLLGCSDSHFLGELGTIATALYMAAPEFGELVLAFKGEKGRSLARA